MNTIHTICSWNSSAFYLVLTNSSIVTVTRTWSSSHVTRDSEARTMLLSMSEFMSHSTTTAIWTQVTLFYYCSLNSSHIFATAAVWTEVTFYHSCCCLNSNHTLLLLLLLCELVTIYYSCSFLNSSHSITTAALWARHTLLLLLPSEFVTLCYYCCFLNS